MSDQQRPASSYRLHVVISAFRWSVLWLQVWPTQSVASLTSLAVPYHDQTLNTSLNVLQLTPLLRFFLTSTFSIEWKFLSSAEEPDDKNQHFRLQRETSVFSSSSYGWIRSMTVKLWGRCSTNRTAHWQSSLTRTVIWPPQSLTSSFSISLVSGSTSMSSWSKADTCAGEQAFHQPSSEQNTQGITASLWYMPAVVTIIRKYFENNKLNIALSDASARVVKI